MKAYRVGAASALVAVTLTPVILLADAFAITRTLAFGSTGDDVRALQTMLARDLSIYPEGLITGYFGALTRRAVQRFQCAYNIVCSGDEASTGYGQVGPRTRAALEGVFGFVAAVTTPTPEPAQNAAPNAKTQQCASPRLEPMIGCSGRWDKIYDGNRCHVGWTCAPVIATSTTATNAAPKVPMNRPPFISAIVGPTKLKSGESGTWMVVASDPEYEAIEYSIIWGDEGGSLAQLLDLARLGIYAFSRQTTYTHAYQSSGSYTIIVFARDTANNDARATLSVTVEQSVAPAVNTGEPGATGAADAKSSAGSGCWHNGKLYAPGSLLPLAEISPTMIGVVGKLYVVCRDGSWFLGDTRIR